jgi:hypothetical protein
MITPHQLIQIFTITFDHGDGVAFDGKFVCVGSALIPGELLGRIFLFELINSFVWLYVLKFEFLHFFGLLCFLKG